MVIVYDDVSGYQKHNTRGSHYHLFRHYGHNIIVSRIIPGPSVHAPDNLTNVLSQSYRKQELCVTSFNDRCGYACVGGLPTCSFHAKRTNDATWNQLQSHVSPVLLCVIQSGIGGARASWFDNRYFVAQRMDGGYVVLVANEQ